jgi:putative peptide zinc metalloprotease protein
MVAEQDISSRNAPSASAWDRLREAIDPASYRPRLRDGLVWKELTTTQGEAYVIIQNPAASTYLRLPADDFFVFQLMDGTATVQQLVVAYMLQFHRFALQHVIQLVQDLRYNEFLTDRPYATYPRVRQLARPRSVGTVLDRVLNLYLNREFPVPGVDRAFDRMYRAGAWVLLTVPGLIVLGAIVLIGVPLLLRDLHLAHISLTDRTLLARYAAIGYVSLLSIAIIHELGHAFAVKSYGRTVRRSGFCLFYGSPGLYVDTQDMWMAPRGARVAASWAGPYSGFILAGLAGIALATLPQGGWVLFVRAFGITALVENAFQLNPFIQYDGYYILMDWLDVYNLRRRALMFIRFDLLHKLWRRERFNHEERIFAVFGLLAAAYTVLAIFLVVTFGWDHAKEAIQTAVRVPNIG